MNKCGRLSLWLLIATSIRDVSAFSPSSLVSKPAVAVRSSQLAMAAVPLVEEWKVDRMGRLTGVVTNHPVIEDGDVITTSALADPKAVSAQTVVETRSGSKYKLGKPKNAPKAVPKANGRAAKSTPVQQPIPFFGNFMSTPAKKSPSKPVAAKPSIDNNKASLDDAKALKAAQLQAKREYGLNGETVGDGQYLLVGKSKRSTSGKSNIWTAYRSDANGLPQGDPVIIKISANKEVLERETANYKKVTSGLRRGMFVNFYEYLDPAGTSASLKNQCALVIEKGDQDLKSYFSQNGGEGLTGSALRDASAAAAQCVQAVHSCGLVWTDLKAENLVVSENANGELIFRGIDLESAMPNNDNPVDYSPEACPPEFAEAFLAGDGPYFVLKYSYDIWSFGMVLYELATGRAYFGGKKPAQITRMLKVTGYEWPVEGIEDSNLKNLIEQCLQSDPKKRPSIAKILLHPYFLSTGVGPFSF